MGTVLLSHFPLLTFVEKLSLGDVAGASVIHREVQERQMAVVLKIRLVPEGLNSKRVEAVR